LTIAVQEGDVGQHIDAGPGHHLPFKSIAVNVDDAGQDHEAAGVDLGGGDFIAANIGNDSVSGADMDACLHKAVADQDTPRNDAQFHFAPQVPGPAFGNVRSPS